ncbi:class I SAM-dependent methyltransferase [Patescibacteria group bacterium]|nr:class I SAM-dependent methyltransferase [Patescibacteria group bacterium]
MREENYNKFNRVYINIDQKFKEQDLWLSTVHKFDKNSSTRKEYKIRFISRIFNLLKMYYMGILERTNVLEKFLFSNLSTKWFSSFKDFWVDYLGNRPIDIFDFHFLRGSYRAKFQEVVHTNERNAKEFVKRWQAIGCIFMVFNAVWRYTKLAYLGFYPFLKYISNNSSILEYGCGIAPITEGLIRYCSYKNLKFTIVDIKQINFFYARWKFANKNYINFITIGPAIKDNLPSGAKYNVIICRTVFEFLTNPVEIVKILHQHLEKGGVLIFDYDKRDCIGLDTKKGQIERKEVLSFIEKNFKILKGKIDYNNSMGLTVAENK